MIYIVEKYSRVEVDAINEDDAFKKAHTARGGPVYMRIIEGDE